MNVYKKSKDGKPSSIQEIFFIDDVQHNYISICRAVDQYLNNRSSDETKHGSPSDFFPSKSVERGTLAYLAFSSGTSGLPKGS
jgi:long-subunit acyl-CoA synthetase (AMP-forming)